MKHVISFVHCCLQFIIKPKVLTAVYLFTYYYFCLIYLVFLTCSYFEFLVALMKSTVYETLCIYLSLLDIRIRTCTGQIYF